MFRQLMILALLLGIVMAFGTHHSNAGRVPHKCLKASNKICRKIMVLRPRMDLDEAYKLSNIFYKKARKYKVSGDLLLSIGYQESTLKLDTIRYISGLQKVDGEYKKVLIGSDFCMMQINSMNITAMKLDTERLLTDAEYCIEAGAKILANFKRLYSRVDPMWWTRYNANTKEHRDRYRGHIERHMVKIETRKPNIARYRKVVALKKKAERERIKQEKERELAFSKEKARASADYVDEEKVKSATIAGLEEILHKNQDEKNYVAKIDRKDSELTLEDFTNLE